MFARLLVQQNAIEFTVLALNRLEEIVNKAHFSGKILLSGSMLSTPYTGVKVS